MTSPLFRLSARDLREIAESLESGRLKEPTELALRPWAAESERAALASAFAELAQDGLQGRALARTLRLLADRRLALGEERGTAELVWTGPELPGSASRSTSTVSRELFRRAARSVLISTFVLYEGKALFAILAERMEKCPELHVRIFLNVPRGRRDVRTVDAQRVRAFVGRFKKEWPGQRFPEVYYDPRSLATKKGEQAVLHAKCIVIDDAEAFISSANFTEAAHERNIETGVLVRQPDLARTLRRQFETLVAAKQLLRLPGL